jgi:1-phosphatidylinositol-4-phosphate 5-kinase
MKGNPLDEEVMEHLEKRIHEIFNLIDENNDGTLTLSEYVNALQKNPQVMDIFEFLKKGVT